MSAFTTRTVKVVRSLNISDEWRVKQIGIGESVRVLPMSILGNGESVITKFKANTGALRFQSDEADQVLVANGNSFNMFRPVVFRAVSHLIVYNHHRPTNYKLVPYNKLVCIIVSPAVTPEVAEDYQEIFG